MEAEKTFNSMNVKVTYTVLFTAIVALIFGSILLVGGVMIGFGADIDSYQNTLHCGLR